MKEAILGKTLQGLEKKGLRRHLRTVSSAQGAKVLLGGKEVLNLCSNNYLGLADDPRIKEAVVKCVQEKGFGSGASRLVCGNMAEHEELEQRIANLKGCPACLVFSSGYMANAGIISGLFGRDDMIFSDRLNHASIVDGIVLSRAQMRRYPHKDMDALEDLLRKNDGAGQKVIVTDSVFSMDGDIAPLEKIVALAQEYQCSVMVDEAHAFGVLGKTGQGAVEHFGLERKIDIQMGTLSKAAGCFGAYVCGSQELISLLINRARSFIYTTGMPPATAAAASAAIDILKKEPQRREQLIQKTEYVRKMLRGMGFDTLDSETPIIPLLVKDPRIAVQFSEKLLAKGILISAIRPPTVPQGTARLRLTVIATHQQYDLDFALEQLQTIGKELCLI